MSSTPKAIKFKVIFNTALAKYANQMGHDLSNVGTEGSNWLIARPVRMDQSKKHRGFYGR
jgi:hypothetical protein